MVKPDYDLNINVMMVGGRRCGKTSVLASMQKCFGQAQVNTPLVICCANNETLDTIEKKAAGNETVLFSEGKEQGFCS